MHVDESQLVTEVMSTDVLLIGPGHTLRQAADAMARRKVGAAVVVDPDGAGLGILTERDILRAVAAADDLDGETARDHQTSDIVYAVPAWSLGQAAEAMLRGNFRHLVVLDGGEVVGMLSVRDIVRSWAGALGATVPVRRPPA